MTIGNFNRLLAIGCALHSLATLGCSPFASHGCTAFGPICGRTTITWQAPDDTWSPGAYVLTLTADGGSTDCSVLMPDPPPTGDVQGVCPSSTSVTLSFAAVQSCPPVVCDASACTGRSCTPIPGHFQLALALEAMPTVLGLALALDGGPIASVTVAPLVKTTEPNGQGCGTCTNASATIYVDGGAS